MRYSEMRIYSLVYSEDILLGFNREGYSVFENRILLYIIY